MTRKFSTLLLAGPILISGCSALLPSEQAKIKTQWKSYEEARAAFDKIVPFQTRVTDLKQLGFDPGSANIKNLSYLQLLNRFLPTPTSTKQDLDKAVLDCLAAKEDCQGCELEVVELRGQRQGSVLLDFFGFRRHTQVSGYEFKALVLLKGDLVVYKLTSSLPSVARVDQRIKPLGPLQELHPNGIFRFADAP